jgi:glycosyltransferase involved in cell wall biosynthesis
MENSLKALAFTNMTASHKWRLSPIADRINKCTPMDEMFVTDYTTWNDEFLGANLIILEMLVGAELVDKAHAAGAKVIYEADDAVIDTYGKERKNLQHLDEKMRGNAIDTIKRCDAVTVTNSELAENFARFTDKPIYILPNYVDFNWYKQDYEKPERNTDEVRLGWFGSRGHFEDLRMLVPLIHRLLDKYPQLRFVYCGYGGISDDKHSTKMKFGEDVFAEIPRDRREFYLPVHEDLWAYKHQTLDIDIGLAPLVNDSFNRQKTPIKWMEYAMCETPTVASRVLYGQHPIIPNKSTIEHGVTGFLCDTIDDWEMYISKLIEDKNLRTSIAKSAKDEVLINWNLDRNWRKWLDIYHEVVFD